MSSGARNPIVIVKIFRARAGNLRGPYCNHNDYSSSFFLSFVQNDHDQMNIPQNSPNLEYKSRLAKNVIIYCRPESPPLDGAVIKESAFWLITPIYFVAHSKNVYPRIQ